MRLRNLIIAGIAAVVPSLSAAMESRVLQTSGAWNVEVNVFDDGSMTCSATTVSKTNTSWISINVDHDDFYTLGGYIHDLYDHRRTADLPFVIGQEDWKLNGANLYQERNGTAFSFGFGYHPNQISFLQDIRRNNTARLVIGKHKDEIFSLRGSLGAIDALEMCRVLLP